MIHDLLKTDKRKSYHYCYRPSEIEQEQVFGNDVINFVLCSIAPQNVLQFSLGSDIIFNMLRKMDNVYVDMGVLYNKELITKTNHAAIRALYSQERIKDFDIIGISLYFVGSYFNIIPLLYYSKIPLLARDRKNTRPLVIAGGGAISTNPEPIAELFDVIIIGDGEEPTKKIIEIINLNLNKTETLLEIKNSCKCAYIPQLKKHNEYIYYNNEKDIGKYILSNNDFVSKPNNKVIEIMRGCYYKCNFCNLGYMRSEPKENKINDIINAIKTYPDDATIYPFAPDESSFKHYDEIINQIGTRKLTRYNQRINTYNMVERTSLNDYRIVFGIDGISQRIRNIVKKQITTDQINRALEFSYTQFDLIKLNLIIAYPFETEDDWDEFETWLDKTLETRRKTSPNKTLSQDEALFYHKKAVKKEKFKLDGTGKDKFIMIQLAPTPFQPEPHTPMENFGLGNIEYATNRLLNIKNKMIKKYGMIKIYGLNSRKSMETTSILKYGGKEILNILYNVFKSGAYNSNGLSSIYRAFYNVLNRSKTNKNNYICKKDNNYNKPFKFIITGNEELKEKRKKEIEMYI